MCKSCCFAVVLAVICLPVILLSLETDAQPTADETMTCGSSAASDDILNVVKMNAKEIKDVKKLLASNPNQCVTAEPSKQALVSALQCKYVVLNTDSTETRMWANAQRDGRPAEHWWRPLFNAANFG